jgi:hypothetical protein
MTSRSRGHKATGTAAGPVQPRAGRVCALLLTIFCGLACGFAATSSASQTHLSLGRFGSAVEQTFGNATGVAVDQSSGDLLVIDASAASVSRFKANGEPDPFSALGTNVIDGKAAASESCAENPLSCDQTPQNGLTFGSFAGEEQVTVDNSGGINDGNIYVTQWEAHLVDVFSGSGEYLGQLTAAGVTAFSAILSPCGVAVDEAGDLYVSGGFDGNVYKYVPAANPPVNGDIASTFGGLAKPCNLAAGAGPTAGALFVNRFFSNEADSVKKISASTGALEYVVETEEGRAVAVDPGTGHLYVVVLDEYFGQVYHVAEYDVSGSQPVAVSSFGGITNAKGVAVDGSTGRIYLAAGSQVLVYSPLVTVPDVTTEGAEITGDQEATVRGTVHPDGVELTACYFEYGPTAAYGQTAPCAESLAEIGTSTTEVHADLSGLEKETLYHYRLVASNENATINGADKTLKTPSKPTIAGTWVVNVSDDAATLQARINPESSPTEYFFEWGLDSSYGNVTPKEAAGEDAEDHVVGFELSGLDPATTYHFRVVATNGVGTSEGPDSTFTTFPVMPPTTCPNQTGASQGLVDCRAYEMVSPVEKGDNDISEFFTLLNNPTALDRPSTDGGRFTYSAQTAFGDAISGPFTSQYLATRTEAGWLSHAISPPRTSGSATTFPASKFDVQYRYFDEDLCSGWLWQDAEPLLAPGAISGYINFYRRDLCGEEAYEALTTATPVPTSPDDYWPGFKGASADGAKAVIAANAKLTPNALETEALQIYEASGEELKLASLLPNGTPTAPAVVGAGEPVEAQESRRGMAARAVSADGSRIFWVAGTVTGPLYVRLNGTKTLTVSATTSRYWTAAVDGSKVIYTTGSELFEAEVTTKVTKALIAGEVLGVVGASEDASRIYFVSKEPLDGGQAGEPNLYLDREGTIVYVGTLDPNDMNGNLRFGITGESASHLTARVSADGEALAFMSAAQLTGFENKDAESEEAAVEVYLYDAATKELRCPSCSPAGARPATREVTGFGGAFALLAAQLPAWQNNLYGSRALSGDGNRLFFDSFDDLLPADRNGKADVYEWEAPGTGGCTIGSSNYFASSGGCLALISSGAAAQDAAFVDATPSGDDAFFKSVESLVTQDPGLVDIYDARVGGGLPESPLQRETCSEAAQCHGPEPLAPAEQSPASSAPGSGNVKPRKHCPKGKVRRKGKCVKKHHKHKKRHRASRRRRTSQ